MITLSVETRASHRLPYYDTGVLLEIVDNLNVKDGLFLKVTYAQKGNDVLVIPEKFINISYLYSIMSELKTILTQSSWDQTLKTLINYIDD